MSINARAAYLGSAVQTASPSRLLVMLCDRLVLDVRRADAAQQADDRQLAHDNFLHAQQIVTQLLTSLRTDVWDGADQLSQVYEYLLRRLVDANLKADRGATAECLDLATRICDTWTKAALASASDRSIA